MDIYTKPENLDENIEKNLGPLKHLVGVWEGEQGIDIAPAKSGPAETKFRERITFTATGPIANGPQVLYGLNYSTLAWRLGEENAFHDELGYWLWDAEAKQVMRCFTVPRGVAVLAGGETEESDKEFSLSAKVGSEVYGIVSNPFLDKAFKTVAYELDVKILEEGVFSYKEDTQLKLMGKEGIFHHTDENTLKRVS